MGDHIPCKSCGHYPAVCEDTISELNEKLAAMTARFDEEETNKLRAIGLYDSCKKDLDAANERSEKADANWKAAEKNLEEMTIAQIQTYSKLVAAERHAEENTRDAERYRWATENVLRFSPELHPERKPISCPDKLAGCMVAHFAPIEKSDIDKVIDDARNEEDKA